MTEFQNINNPSKGRLNYSGNVPIVYFQEDILHASKQFAKKKCLATIHNFSFIFLVKNVRDILHGRDKHDLNITSQVHSD